LRWGSLCVAHVDLSLPSSLDYTHMPSLPNLRVKNFFFLQYRGLNRELYTCLASALPLELCLKPKVKTFQSGIGRLREDCPNTC
jgi:hypothetical protein